MSVALALKARLVATRPAARRALNGREELVFAFMFRFGILSQIEAMLTASAGASVSPIPGMACSASSGKPSLIDLDGGTTKRMRAGEHTWTIWRLNLQGGR